ncbi:MAG: hypothetical protein ACUVTD_09445 [Nitrososphaerales archaeon]
MLTDKQRAILEKAMSEYYESFKDRCKDVEKAIEATRNFARGWATAMFQERLELSDCEYIERKLNELRLSDHS